jgi:hypothetical protein
MTKMKGIENLCSWKNLLVRIKQEVDWVLGCVAEGMKGCGLGQKKPKFAKRANLVGSVMGLGPIVGFKYLSPRILMVFEADLGLSTGLGVCPDLGGCLNPLISSEAMSSVVKVGFFQYEGFAPSRLKMPNATDGHSSRPYPSVGRVYVLSVADIPLDYA